MKTVNVQLAGLLSSHKVLALVKWSVVEYKVDAEFQTVIQGISTEE